MANLLLPIADGKAPAAPFQTLTTLHIMERWDEAPVGDKDIESSWPFEIHSGFFKTR